MWIKIKPTVYSNLDEAVAKVQSSPNETAGYALMADATDVRYLAMTNCDLQMVGREYAMKPYALAVQQGSPLKEKLDEA